MPRDAHLYPALLALHQRFMAGDPTLLGDIARLVLEPLTKQIRHKFPEDAFPSVDDHLVLQAAADALLEYGEAPAKANATSGAGVLGFLLLRAASRLRNTLRQERVRQRAEGRYAHGLGPRPRQESNNSVELHLVRGEHGVELLHERVAAPQPDDPAEAMDQQTLRADVLASVESDRDRQILQMMLDGIRATASYAEVLGITELPFNEQRSIVKQHKDRIKAAASRRQAAKRSGPRRRGRPPRRPEGDRE